MTTDRKQSKDFSFLFIVTLPFSMPSKKSYGSMAFTASVVSLFPHRFLTNPWYSYVLISEAGLNIR